MEATLTCDEAMMVRAARFYWRKKLGLSYVVSIVIVIASVPMAAATDWPQWIAGAVAAVAAIGVFVPLYGFVHAARLARANFRRLDPPLGHVVLDEDGVTMTTNIGTGKMKWSGVVQLWREPEFSLLFTAEDSFVVLPTAGAPAGFHEMLAERVRAAGGKVR
jgi:hypothetical protein